MSPSASVCREGPGGPPPSTVSRASWSGQLELGPLKLPVKAYPALVAPSHGPLCQIHSGCSERVSQRKVCPKHGELTAADIGKAFEFGPNDPLTFSAQELDSLSPADDETIRIEHLLPDKMLDYSLLSGRTLYLAPAHPAAEPFYARAVAILNRQSTWAVGRMVLSEQRRAVGVRVDSSRLLLCVLHWPEHQRAYPGVDVDVAAVTPAELRALEKALVPLHKSFRWEEYRDQGAERLNALIAAKLEERQVVTQGAAGKRTKAVSPAGASRKRRAA